MNQGREHPQIDELLLRMALDYLTSRQREIWDFYNLDRLTQDEIAEKLDISRTAVQGHLKAIVNRIAKFCKQNRAAYILLKLEHKIMNEEND